MPEYRIYFRIKSTVPVNYTITAENGKNAVEKAVTRLLRDFDTDDHDIIESMQVNGEIPGSPGPLPGEDYPYKDA